MEYCDRAANAELASVRPLKRAVFVGSALLFAALAGQTTLAHAETYPSRPVKFIVPVGAGGANDFVARVVARELTDKWGQSVVIENRPGATSTIATETVFRANPDGYTALFGSTQFVQAPALFKSVQYDFRRDFEPVTLTNSLSVVFFVKGDVPFKTLGEYIQAARAKNGLTYGSVGIGTSLHIYGATLAHETNTNMVHVIFRSEPDMITAVLSGDLDSGFTSFAAVLPLIREGKLRALAVAGTERHELAPDIPTFNEQGFSKLNLIGWNGVFVRAGTPAPVIDKLSTDINAALRKEEVITRFRSIAVKPIGTTPDEFKQRIENDFLRWQELIRDAKISVP
jgi:tripartite-type tricarboxylate transporter receptor subunit TctC